MSARPPAYRSSWMSPPPQGQQTRAPEPVELSNRNTSQQSISVSHQSQVDLISRQRASTSKWSPWCPRGCCRIFCCCANSCNACCSDLFCGGQPKDEKCRSLSCCPPVRRCCSSRITRGFCLIFSLILLVWTAFAVRAVLEFMRMADSKFVMQKMVMSDLCSDTPPFFLEGDLHNPSALSLTLHELDITVTLDGATKAAGSMTFSPSFNGGDTFQPGDNLLSINTAMHSIDSTAAGQIVSLMVANTDNIPLKVSIKLKLTIPADAFWVPISTTVSSETLFYLNDKRKPQEEEPKRIRPPPKLEEMVLSLNSTSSNRGGLLARSLWTVWSSQPDFNVSVPSLVARVGQTGTHLAEVNVSAFKFAFPGRVGLEIQTPHFDDTDTGMIKLQQLMSDINSNTSFTLQVAGVSGQDSACLAQDVLNKMPTASLVVIPKPFDPESCENRPLSNPCTVAEAAQAQKPDEPPLALKAVAVNSVSKPPKGPFEAQLDATMLFQFGYALYGVVPSVFLDVYSRDKLLGYFRLNGLSIPNQALHNFTLAAVVEDQTTALSRVFNFKSLEDLDVTLRGRKGQNMLSSMLHGLVINVTEALNSDPTAPTPAPTPAPQRAEKAVIVNTDYNSTAMWLTLESVPLDLNFNFSVSVPPVALQTVRTHALQGDYTSGDYLGSAVDVHFDRIAIPVGPWQGTVGGRLQVTAPQGVVLGALVDDFANDYFVHARVNTSSVLYAGTDTLPVDINVNFSMSQFTDVVGDSGTSAAKAKVADTTVLAAGPLELAAFYVKKWHRSSASHSIALQSVVKTRAHAVELRGRFPQVVTHIDIDMDNRIRRALDAQLSGIVLAQVEGQSFNVVFNMSTRDEALLVRTAAQVGASRQRVRALITDAGSESILPHVLARLNLSVILAHNDTVAATAPSSSETEEIGLDNVNWQPLVIALASPTNAVTLSATTKLPISLSANLSISDVPVEVIYEPEPPSAPRHSLLNISFPSVVGCTDGCLNTFALSASSVQADNGNKLAGIVADIIEGRSKMPLRLRARGQLTDINVDFLVGRSNQSTLFQTIAREFSEADDAPTPAPSTSTGTNASALTVHGVHIMGSVPETQPMVVPCVVPGVLCPKSAAGLSSTPAVFALNVSVDSPLPFPVTFHYPDIDVQGDCCILNHVATLGLRAGTFSTASPSLVQMKAVIQDTALLQLAVQDLLQGKVPFTFRVRGSSTGNMISNLMSQHEEVITIPASPPCTGICPPPRPVSPWGKEHLNIDHWLSSTSQTHMEVTAEVTVKSPLPFPFRMGPVDVSFAYDGFNIVTANFPLNIEPGWNALQVPVRIASLSTAEASAPRCGGDRFCAINGFFSRAMNNKLYPEGTNTTFTMGFRNALGVQTSMKIDLVMLTFNPAPRQLSSPTKLGLVEDVAFQKLTTVMNLITGSVSSETFNANAKITMRNILNITFILNTITLDVDMRDFDGVLDYAYIPGTPMTPDLNFNLLQDASHTFNNWQLVPNQVGTATIGLEVPYANLPERIIRIYDDVIVKNKLCAHIRNGRLVICFPYPGSDPFCYTQGLDIPNLAALGKYDCGFSLGCDPVHTQLWKFGFNSANFTTVGSATVDGTAVTLTNSGDEKGAVWTKQRINILDRWEVQFTMQMNALTCGVCPFCADCAQADGIAFVIQNSSPNAMGNSCTSGFCHAYKNIGNSVGIIFDSYNANEIGLFINGDVANPIISVLNPVEFDDGNPHQVRVQYLPNSRNIFVFIDSKIQITAEVLLDGSQFSWSNKTAFLGFTAATGNVAKSRHTVRDFSFGVVETSVNASFVVEEGLVRGRVGQQGSVTIDSRDSCQGPVLSGGAKWSIWFVGPVTTAATSVQDHGDGTYTVFFVATQAGTYSVMGSLPGAASASLGSIVVNP